MKYSQNLFISLVRLRVESVMKICKYFPKMSEQKIYSIETINNHKNGDNLYAKNLIPIISFPLYSTVVVYDEQHGEEEENRIISSFKSITLEMCICLLILLFQRITLFYIHFQFLDKHISL